MKIKGLLFDLDGVICDTARYHYLAWKELTEELGIPFDEEENERLKGVSRMHSLEIILEREGRIMSLAEKELCCDRKNELYLSSVRKMTPADILPGVTEFLQTARAQGYRLAIGSASRNSRFILEKIRLLDAFDRIVDGTMVQRSKPDPEVYLKAAQVLGLSCTECVVFEDAAAGVEAGHRAGMPVIGIGTAEKLPGADLCIEGFWQQNVNQLMMQLQ